MSETSHTPRPWVANKKWKNIHAGKKCVAVLGRGAHSITCAVEQRANLHLIAAAPEMLEALKLMVHEAEVCDHFKVTVGSLALKMARAAITKAEGRS